MGVRCSRAVAPAGERSSLSAPKGSLHPWFSETCSPAAVEGFPKGLRRGGSLRRPSVRGFLRARSAPGRPSHRIHDAARLGQGRGAEPHQTAGPRGRPPASRPVEPTVLHRHQSTAQGVESSGGGVAPRSREVVSPLQWIVIASACASTSVSSPLPCPPPAASIRPVRSTCGRPSSDTARPGEFGWVCGALRAAIRFTPAGSTRSGRMKSGGREQGGPAARLTKRDGRMPETVTSGGGGGQPPKEMSMEIRTLLAVLLAGAVMFLSPYLVKTPPHAGGNQDRATGFQLRRFPRLPPRPFPKWPLPRRPQLGRYARDVAIHAPAVRHRHAIIQRPAQQSGRYRAELEAQEVQWQRRQDPGPGERGGRHGLSVLVLYSRPGRHRQNRQLGLLPGGRRPRRPRHHLHLLERPRGGQEDVPFREG